MYTCPLSKFKLVFVLPSNAWQTQVILQRKKKIYIYIVQESEDVAAFLADSLSCMSRYIRGVSDEAVKLNGKKNRKKRPLRMCDHSSEASRLLLVT